MSQYPTCTFASHDLSIIGFPTQKYIIYDLQTNEALMDRPNQFGLAYISKNSIISNDGKSIRPILKGSEFMVAKIISIQ
jgi:hypothetical protein